MTNAFRHFKELVYRLSKKELLLLKRKIDANSDVNDKNKNKSKHLLRLILGNKEITQIELEKELYGVSNKVAFDKLIDRSTEKIDEILIGFNREASSLYSERNYYYFYLKRKLIVLQMKWLRGIDFDLQSQFDKIISLSRKYEHYEILIDVLHVKQRYVAFRFGKLEFDKIEIEIEKAEANRKAMLMARRINSGLGAYLMFYDSVDKEVIKKSIKLLSQGFKISKSPTIKYYLMLHEIAWLQAHNRFSKAETLLKNVLKLIIENPSVYTKTRHGDVILNLALNEIHLQQFHLVISNSLKAKEYYEEDTETMSTVLEIEFYGRFYNNEIDKCEEIIKNLYHYSRQQNSPFLLGIRAYLYASVETFRGKIEMSNKLLEEVKEIDKDKGGWNLGKRILAIINGIESEDYEGVELKVLSLEKFIKRISKTNYVRKRDKLISRILLKLINENFDFNKVYTKRKEYFDLLEGNDPEYAWKIKSPELIVFHEWFKAKMKEKSRQEVLI
jgi:hypothetical protein